MELGGAFLVSEAEHTSVLTPEKLDSETRMMAQAAAQFMQGEVLPAADRIEAKEDGLLPGLMKRGAQLGLLSTDVPQEYGGLGLTKSASARVAEALAAEPSFAVSQSVHSTVATLPLLLFGNEEQQRRYLPQLASAELIGAYALSESHAGTDAMAMRTRALPSQDGSHFILSGEKMWITNAAFAGLFTVFAKVDDQVTAFLVERAFPGVSVGREEHKLGLKGSSTCRLIMDNVPVPVTNQLGNIGEGGKIALLALNLGRFKIAAGSVGQSKNLLGIATRYARQREAFGKPISEFGLIQEKLARMAERIYASESMLYRLAGFLDEAFREVVLSSAGVSSQYKSAAEEYAIECALVKVACTECLDFVADETVQIHGGYGYTEEFPAARAWRDARVTRIYEGTNEINRLNVAGLLLKRIAAGRIVLPSDLAPLDDLTAIAPVPRMFDTPPYPSQLLRHCALHVLKAALNREAKVLEVQGVAGALTDMLTALYSAESAIVRHAGFPEIGSERARKASGMARAETFYRCHKEFRAGAAAILAECGDPGWALWKKMEPLLEEVRAARVTLRSALARVVIEGDGYPI